MSCCTLNASLSWPGTSYNDEEAFGGKFLNRAMYCTQVINNRLGLTVECCLGTTMCALAQILVKIRISHRTDCYIYTRLFRYGVMGTFLKKPGVMDEMT